MKANSRYFLPAIATVLLTASMALAQMPANGAGRGPGRTPPTAEQMAARRTQFCADLQARQAARLAYIETRLNLTAAQKPLFDRWKTAVQAQGSARQADCAKPRPAPQANGARPTLPERTARMEDRLKSRLAALTAIQGPQDALYNALTPEQKPLFENAGRGGRGMRGRGFGRGGFGRGFGGRRPV
jgi:hypothetical protein